LIFILVNDVDEAEKMIEQYYHGSHESEADFVENFLEDTGAEIPHHLAGYINFKAMPRDWVINDFYSLEVGSDVHVFSHY